MIKRHKKLFWLYDNKLKIFAVIFILSLAFADFLTMYNLFINLNLSDISPFGGKALSEIIVYSFTVSVLLEGNPTFIGIAASTLADKTKYKANDRFNAILGLIVSSLGLLFTIALVWYLRYLIIYQNGGADAFFGEGHNYGGNNKTNAGFIAQVYLFFAPLLTSMLAFVASWTAFRQESIEKLEYRLDVLHSKFLIAQSEFLDTMHKNDDARTALWGSLTVKDKMPTDLDTFRKESFDRIRSKLISNCISEFPNQVERYNVEVTSVLQDFIIEMRNKTTSNPRDFEQYKVEEAIAKYDEKKKADKNVIDAWSYIIAGEELEKKLKIMLDNAVVIARFKTTVRPYHKEGDYK